MLRTICARVRSGAPVCAAHVFLRRYHLHAWSVRTRISRGSCLHARSYSSFSLIHLHISVSTRSRNWESSFFFSDARSALIQTCAPTLLGVSHGASPLTVGVTAGIFTTLSHLISCPQAANLAPTGPSKLLAIETPLYCAPLQQIIEHNFHRPPRRP